MEALKVYQDMTSPTPTHRVHTLPPPGKKGVSKSAAKQQRAKQRQEAAEAAAVGTVARASRAVATAVESQPAGGSASRTEQVDFDRHNGQAGTRNQKAYAPAFNGNIPQADAHSSDQTAERVAQSSLDAGLSPPSASDLSAAREDKQSRNSAGAHKSSPAMSHRGIASQPWTDPVMASKQATASGPTNGHVSKLRTTTANPVRFSSSSSSSTGPASMSAMETLLLKPDRQQASEPAYASSVSENTSDASHRIDSAELLQPSDLPPGSDLHTLGSPQQQQGRSPGGGGGLGLGSSGDKGRGPNGAQAEAVLGKRPVALVSSSDSSHGHARLVGSLKLSQRAICFPSIGATAALVHAFALANDIQECFR